MTPACQEILTLEQFPERAHALRHIYRLERGVAAVSLLLAAPFLLAVALIIVVLSGRSPLVRHKRVGFGGADLRMLKFRTMWQGRAQWGPPYWIEDVSAAIPENKHKDGRITSRFAAWCRRYSIDELPQLYHVACGEMSLVGPRPITRQELEQHYGEQAGRVLSIRPGLTGLWQVLGRSRLRYAQRKRLDLWLVRNASPGLYFWILWRSIPQVLHGHDAY